ncbi:hypothetical protein CVT24_007606 [Panaeolus cyanescens]|uniref:Uncharacterized protein n=1 Tax=Panaeolus cyanescens TaxID=181874 RepID=A0A409YLV2_9AGAR|nr:hypothetical protein CVT24_007606 [Panaeolus cyanescens]
MDSFCYPLYVELIKLELGIEAYDGTREQLFLLRAFLILVFGDIPAISLMMCMKGHNGLRPCRMCNIRGVTVDKVHYVPLSRSCVVQTKDVPLLGREYRATNLPLRTHDQMMQQAKEVHDAITQTSADNLAKEYGIKGIPALSHLSSLTFPTSFPFDFMYLIWENTLKNLILFWTGKFKDIDHKGKGYHIAKHIWDSASGR